jgi:energy-converting hydrogenase B subunit D
MIWQLDVWLLGILIVAAIVALEVRDLLVAVVVLTGFNFLMALLFAGLGAVDVALTEAALGAGLVGVFFVMAVFYTERKSAD